MVILLAGASHTGKTALAKKLMKQYQISYLSIDHIKMGLIRGGYTTLTAMDDEKLTTYLWPMLREMIKTVIENEQDLIIEGCYIPFDWEKDFSSEYQKQIRYYCLVMSESYIKTHMGDIRKYANVAEKRLDDTSLDMEELINDNSYHLYICQKHHLPFLLLDQKYEVSLEL